MAQSSQMIQALKRSLKLHGRTYADVAAHLGLSEASVKRLFARQAFSLKRLEQVCALLEMELTDLLQIVQREGGRRTRELTLDQEREIAADIELMLVAVCVLNRWHLTEILEHFDIPEHRCIHHLARLDRMRLIELLPGNRIRLRASPNFKWRDNGPIQQFFQHHVQQAFFGSRFDRSGERLLVINGMLSDSANALFQRRMEQLAEEFEQLNDEDAQLPLEQRHGATVVLAIRPWGYGLFEPLRRG
ncbi:MAG: helix-turn-helix transcriptional regulator [Candidatus Sedimenticola endophacoides]